MVISKFKNVKKSSTSFDYISQKDLPNSLPSFTGPKSIFHEVLC